jgi:hypothetical protein
MEDVYHDLINAYEVGYSEWRLAVSEHFDEMAHNTKLYRYLVRKLNKHYPHILERLQSDLFHEYE